MIVYLTRDIPAFVTYCVNGASRSSLLIESTNSMISMWMDEYMLYIHPPTFVLQDNHVLFPYLEKSNDIYICVYVYFMYSYSSSPLLLVTGGGNMTATSATGPPSDASHSAGQCTPSQTYGTLGSPAPRRGGGREVGREGERKGEDENKVKEEVVIIESVDSISRDEPDSPLTQYIKNAGISRARYTITHFKHHHRVLRLISNRISV